MYKYILQSKNILYINMNLIIFQPLLILSRVRKSIFFFDTNEKKTHIIFVEEISKIVTNIKPNIKYFT